MPAMTTPPDDLRARCEAFVEPFRPNLGGYAADELLKRTIAFVLAERQAVWEEAADELACIDLESEIVLRRRAAEEKERFK